MWKCFSITDMIIKLFHQSNETNIKLYPWLYDFHITYSKINTRLRNGLVLIRCQGMTQGGVNLKYASVLL